MFPAQRTGSKVWWIFVILICAASFSFMLYAALRESAIVDEAAHIPAGYAYVHELDFRLNPEHPPLVKALAALPLLLIQPSFPTDHPAWTTDLNGQWAMGEQFLYRSGNDADIVVAVSRVMPILLTLLTVLFIYFWSGKLVGGAWALLPAFLFALSPTVLAHGHYVTTDIGAAFGVLFATYFFLKMLREPSPKNIVIAGVALGVAELMKFSAVLLFPYFILLAVTHFFVNSQGLRGKYFWQVALRKFGQLAAVFATCFLLVIYPAYGLFTAHYPQERQAADTQAIIASLPGESSPGGPCSLIRCIAQGNLWMTNHEVTRPLAQYFLGVVMVMARSVGGNTAYFLGEVSRTGSHLYFPVVYLLKESLPALIVVLGALLAGLWNAGRALGAGKIGSRLRAYLQDNFTEFALLVFVIIYWTYSIKSTLNIGVRHLMPVIPIMYILSAGVWRKWIVGSQERSDAPTLAALWSTLRSWASSWFKLSILCALLLWSLLETLGTAPHFLSYFNQLGGSAWNGYRYVTDSNYDWGQDLIRLREFVDEHPEIDKIAVDIFGAPGAPAYYLDDRGVNWWSARGNPADHGISWLAISVNTLQNLTQPATPDLGRRTEESYPWLASLRPAAAGMGQVPEPDYRIGTSIFVYRL